MMTESPSYKRTMHLGRYHYGAAYYPEHWSAAERADDAVRMAAARFQPCTYGRVCLGLPRARGRPLPI